MPPDISNLRGTIVPKSDQLNAEQLLGGPMTLTVTDVRLGSEDQPVSIHYANDEGRPFKPCKTMRKVLIFAWGEDGRNWIGRTMTVYNDPAVRFGGMAVGGIRISHLSDIEREITVSLTATKGKKAMHTIAKLEGHAAPVVPTLSAVLAAIKAATGRDTMAAAKALAEQLTAEADIAAALIAYRARVAELKKPTAAAQADQSTGETTPPPSKQEAKPEVDVGPYTRLVEKMEAAGTAEAGLLILDEGRTLADEQRTALAALFEQRFPD